MCDQVGALNAAVGAVVAEVLPHFFVDHHMAIEIVVGSEGTVWALVGFFLAVGSRVSCKRAPVSSGKITRVAFERFVRRMAD